MLGVRVQIADVCLGVTAGSVQQHQHRLAGIAGTQVAGSHAAGVEVALLERDTLQIAPHAFELGHGSSLAGLAEIWFSFPVNCVC